MMQTVQTIAPPSAAKVFIVDDDPALCRVLSAVLRDAGHKCEIFTSAQDFLDAVDPDAAGCLLLDIRMPEMSGPELQAAMVQRGFSLPIIFLSASADVPTTVGVLRRGAVDLIEKPCEPRILIRAVERAVTANAVGNAQRSELKDLRQRMSQLTPREHEVADLMALGNSNRQTAIALGLSERTVEIHRARVMAKMACESIVSFGIQWVKIQAAAKSDKESSGLSPVPAKNS